MPVTTIRTYHRPPDVDAAWALLSAGGDAVRLLAGGSDLVVRCPPQVRELVDLADAGLGGVTTSADGQLRLGAMATFTELLEVPEVVAYGTGVVGDVVGQLGSVLHRNSATIGGHVARARMSDLIPVLVAVDATVALHDGAAEDRPEPVVPLAELLAGLPRPHLITAVLLPVLPPRSAAAFERFSRTSFDHALLNACCRVDLDDAGRVAGSRIVVGEPAILGRRLPAAEAALPAGAPLTSEAIAEVVRATRGTVECRDDGFASAEYRRHLAGLAVGRCLTRVATELQEGAP
jgi:aerobic carbon-monoxide dehydrogenase medium subunit